MELDGSSGSDVEIAYFGLLAAFTGQGLGGHLLTEAIRHAWTLSDRHPVPATTRVWVHTCSNDGPAALANYRARGLRVFRKEQSEEPLPPTPPGPWPGAR